ncbi:unnamed protein product, partial [Symbiodinium necroappetens]
MFLRFDSNKQNETQGTCVGLLSPNGLYLEGSSPHSSFFGSLICAADVILWTASTATVLCLSSCTQALKHRFYPFAPGVAPEELEQLLLIHAFEDLLAKAQPERSWCCADRIWREQIPSSLLGQTLEAALRSEPFADAAYLPRHDALLLALHHRAAPGRVLWHAWQGDLLADPQDAKWQSSVLVTHPTYNDWAQVHGSGLVSSSTPTKLQVVENMDARDVGYNAIVEKLACPPDGSLILVSRMESGI